MLFIRSGENRTFSPSLSIFNAVVFRLKIEVSSFSCIYYQEVDNFNTQKSTLAYDFMVLSLLVATATVSGMMFYVFGRSTNYDWVGAILFIVFSGHILLHWLDVLRVGGWMSEVVKPEQLR